MPNFIGISMPLNPFYLKRRRSKRNANGLDKKNTAHAVCSRGKQIGKRSRKQSLSYRSKWSLLQSPINWSFVYTSGQSNFGNHTSDSLYSWTWSCCYHSDFKLWFMQILMFEVLFGFWIQPFFLACLLFFFYCSNNSLSKNIHQNL